MAVGTREIQLTKGLAALVDADDFDWLNQWKWCFNGGYAVRGLVKERGGRQLFQMHRAILRPEPHLFVDHIDGDGLNNTRENLRVCTTAQNAWNTGALRADKLKGAHWHRGGWQAFIRANGVRFYLGRFRTEEAAGRAYDAAAIKHHGEFARLNFPVSA